MKQTALFILYNLIACLNTAQADNAIRINSSYMHPMIHSTLSNYAEWR